MQNRTTARLLLVTLGAASGFVGTALAGSRVVGRIGFIDAILEKPFSIAIGIASGGLIGFLFWTLFRPRRRISRLAMGLVAVNSCAWLLYLASTPRLSTGEDPVLRQRAEQDVQQALGWPNGFEFVDHSPSLLAGRPLTWAYLPEKPLGLMAGPTVVFVEQEAVPERYWQTGPTVSASYWVASFAFLLSTAWWVAVGYFAPSLLRIRTGTLRAV
jgi:hypothetical protein